jgi:hypothetical protein
MAVALRAASGTINSYIPVAAKSSTLVSFPLSTLASTRQVRRDSGQGSRPLGLGDHPKPASRDHLKTGQLQTSNQDKIVVPYLESFGKFFPIRSGPQWRQF